LDRVVIPIALRRLLEIEIKDSLEIYIMQDQIILKKYKLSEKNVRLADSNIILSPERTKQLIREVQQNSLDNN